MAYVIEALIAKSDVLRKASLGLKFPIVSLPFGMALIPLDEDLLKLIGINRLLMEHYQEILVDKNLDHIGESISNKGSKVAFIQANMFPGIGGQACLVWDSGNRIRLEVSGNAINHAIEEIDDTVWSADKEDEFECLQLGRFRSTDEWVEIAEQISPADG